MYNTALRLTGNHADAEDIIQEAFTDAYVQLRSFENRASFGAWLKQIVVYKSIALLKKNKIKLAGLEGEDMPEEPPAAEEKWNDLTVEDIRDCIRQLPDGYRMIVSLYLLEDYNQEEISEMLGISHSTVRTQYMRGRKKLAALLKKKKETL